ncbi:unnamed protein product [Amoebophrya sp. A25]|nr:unnamed protein product [Amoebophrya sp. A25]|eukprot:GSA25T00011390001.1
MADGGGFHFMGAEDAFAGPSAAQQNQPQQPAFGGYGGGLPPPASGGFPPPQQASAVAHQQQQQRQQMPSAFPQQQQPSAGEPFGGPRTQFPAGGPQQNQGQFGMPGGPGGGGTPAAGYTGGDTNTSAGGVPDFFGGTSSPDPFGRGSGGGSASSSGPAAGAQTAGAGLPTQSMGQFGAGDQTAYNQSNYAQPYINLSIDPEDINEESAGPPGSRQNNFISDAGVNTRMGLFVQSAQSGGSFKQVKPELAHKYGVEMSGNQLKASSSSGAQSTGSMRQMRSEAMATRGNSAALRAATLDFESHALRLERPGERDIFDLVVQAETTQLRMDELFFGFQAMLAAAAFFVLYIVWGYWSDSTRCLELMQLFEPGLSRITFALAQIASVGSLLRVVKCYEHLRAFDTYENNFAILREEGARAAEPKKEKVSVVPTAAGLRAAGAPLGAGSGMTGAAVADGSGEERGGIFSRYENIMFLSENRLPLVKQAGVCAGQVITNIATVCLCMATAYGDMRIKNGYNQDFTSCKGTTSDPLLLSMLATGTDPVSATYTPTSGSLGLGSASLAFGAGFKTEITPDPAQWPCACKCAECCWKESNDLQTFANDGFTAWRVQTMVKALFALLAFALSVRERGANFYYCSLPVRLPRGI